MPKDNAAQSETLQVTVTAVMHYNEEDGFAIMRAESIIGEEVKILGNYHENPKGQDVIVHGVYEHNETHGEQFRAAYIEPDRPTHPHRIASYLGALGIPGIGPAIARHITDRFGPTTLGVIDRTPERLREVPRVKEETIDYLKENWKGIGAHRELVLFLIDAGIQVKKVHEIREALGFAAEARIRKDPYVLCRAVRGFGFDRADAIARRFGIDPQSDVRKRALVDLILSNALSQGICGVPRVELLEKSIDMLKLPAQEVIGFVDGLIDQGHFVCEEVEDTAVIYLPHVIATERRLAEHISDISNGAPAWRQIDADAEIDEQSAMTGFRLGGEQRGAVRTILNSRMSVMTGGPGVGKTTTLKTALDILSNYGVKIALCAPTNMAAKRMSEMTGRKATTIHSLLEVSGETGGFRRNASNPIEADLIVADEFSMTDINLAESLLKAVDDGTSVLFVGDVDQLPSVGPGRVLHDLIMSNAMPVSRLTEVFRQGKESMIIQAAHAMNRGELPPPAPSDIPKAEQDYLFLRKSNPRATQEAIIEMVCERLQHHPLLSDGFDPIRDVMVISAMKEGEAGVNTLNLKLRQRLNPLPEVGSNKRLDVLDGSGKLRVAYGIGDKVMNTVNDTDAEIVNGDIGLIIDLDPDGRLLVDFDGHHVEMEGKQIRDLQLAYATTVHKAQGAESKVLIMPVVDQFNHMLQRNLIYTGLTRAKKLGIMVGSMDALEKSVRNIDNQKRWSFTAEAIRRQMDVVPEDDLALTM